MVREMNGHPVAEPTLLQRVSEQDRTAGAIKTDLDIAVELRDLIDALARKMTEGRHRGIYCTLAINYSEEAKAFVTSVSIKKDL